MRIAVIGTSGSGKSTLAKRLARELSLTHIELDAINWQPDWQGLNEHDPDELVRRVDAATSDDGWVAEGGYAQVRPLVWGRAQHLIWLDYPRGLIMRRVIARSVLRDIDRKPLWNGNRERARMWLTREHPIRWAWDSWGPNRKKFSAALAEPAFAHLAVHRLSDPGQAEALIARLKTGDPKT